MRVYGIRQRFIYADYFIGMMSFAATIFAMLMILCNCCPTKLQKLAVAIALAAVFVSICGNIAALAFFNDLLASLVCWLTRQDLLPHSHTNLTHHTRLDKSQDTCTDAPTVLCSHSLL